MLLHDSFVKDSLDRQPFQLCFQLFVFLRLDVESVRVAVSLWLGLGLCIPDICQCGADVDAQGGQAMVCKRPLGKTARHHALNDIIRPALTCAD